MAHLRTIWRQLGYQNDLISIHACSGGAWFLIPEVLPVLFKNEFCNISPLAKRICFVKKIGQWQQTIAQNDQWNFQSLLKLFTSQIIFFLISDFNTRRKNKILTKSTLRLFFFRETIAGVNLLFLINVSLLINVILFWPVFEKKQQETVEEWVREKIPS